jgi:hypothetical protein
VRGGDFSGVRAGDFAYKARVDLGDHTAEFIPSEATGTTISTYFCLLLGTNVRILVSAINTRFPPDAPRRCMLETGSCRHRSCSSHVAGMLVPLPHGNDTSHQMRPLSALTGNEKHALCFSAQLPVGRYWIPSFATSTVTPTPLTIAHRVRRMR